MSPLRVISLELFSFSCCLFSADLDNLVSQNLCICFTALLFYKKIFMKSLLFFQVPMEQLCGWGTPERLPRHRVPSLPTGRSAVTGCRALRALHGGTWRLWLLPPTILRPDALGMRPPFRSSCTRKVLWEVPALHAIHSGKRVPTGRELLLHLWVQPLKSQLALKLWMWTFMVDHFEEWLGVEMFLNIWKPVIVLLPHKPYAEC